MELNTELSLVTFSTKSYEIGERKNEFGLHPFRVASPETLGELDPPLLCICDTAAPGYSGSRTAQIRKILSHAVALFFFLLHLFF